MKSTTVKRLLSLVLSGGLLLNSCLPVGAQGTIGNTLKVTANFDQLITRTHHDTFGIDNQSMFDPTVAAPTSPLRQALGNMHVGLLRMMAGAPYFYSSGTGLFAGGQDSWVVNQQWNEAKIQAAVKELPRDMPVIICISNWPSWMSSTNGTLDPSQYGAFATWCGSLAQIVKKARSADHKIYFEIFNEASSIDNFYYNSNSNQKLLAQIYNNCAQAIKAVDPRAVVGGPAVGAACGDQSVFIQNAAANLDFFTIHVYPDENSLTQTNNAIYQVIRTDSYVQQIVSELNQYSPNKYIPLIVDEYNINWHYKKGSGEPRQQTNVGAVSDTIFNISAIMSGAHATAAFQDYGSTSYLSHIQKNYSLYPNGNALLLLNEFFVGDITASTSPDLTQLVTLACKSAKGRCLLIANENPTATSVSVSCGRSIKSDKTYTAYIIDASGFRATSFTGSALLSQINLTNDSVTVLLLDR